jgi:hypothetical protein
LSLEGLAGVPEDAALTIDRAQCRPIGDNISTYAETDPCPAPGCTVGDRCDEQHAPSADHILVAHR